MQMRIVTKGISGFVLRRFLLGLLTLFLVSLIVFAATQALPSDPARAILGRTATPESLAALRKQLNLDRPVFTQYTDWMKGVVQGDFGNSLAARGEPVTQVLGTRLRNSAFLVLIAGLISVPLSIFLGVISARWRDGPFDHATSVLMLALASGQEIRLGDASDLRLKLAVAARILPLASGAHYLDVSVPDRSVAGFNSQLSG